MQKDGLFYSGFLFFQNESRPPPSKTSRTGNAAPRVRRTLHGRELESAGPDAATLLAYDGFGRAVSRTVTNAAEPIAL